MAETRKDWLTKRVRDLRDAIATLTEAMASGNEGEVIEYEIRNRRVRKRATADSIRQLDQALCLYEYQLDSLDGRARNLAKLARR